MDVISVMIKNITHRDLAAYEQRTHVRISHVSHICDRCEAITRTDADLLSTEAERTMPETWCFLVVSLNNRMSKNASYQGFETQ